MLTVESKRQDGIAQEYRIEAACILGCDDASLIPYRHPLVSALRVLTEAVVFSVLLIWAVPRSLC
jgi:hypothetical protein